MPRRSATSRHTAARLLAGIVSTRPLAHEGVPEAVAGLGRLDDAARERRLELFVGRVLVGAGQGEQLVGREDHAEQGDPLERLRRSRRKARRRRRTAVGWPARGWRTGCPRRPGRSPRPCVRELREPVGEESTGRRRVERAQLDARPGAASYEALGDLLGRLGDAGPVSHRDDDGFGHRTPREVVQQPQRGLVGVLEVVDDQQQAAPGRGEPHQLGHRDEEPLVTRLAGPRHLAAGESLLDLGPEAVVEPVQQRRDACDTARRRPRAPARRATALPPPRRCRVRCASRAGSPAPRPVPAPRSCRRRACRRTAVWCRRPRRRATSRHGSGRRHRGGRPAGPPGWAARRGRTARAGGRGAARPRGSGWCRARAAVRGRVARTASTPRVRRPGRRIRGSGRGGPPRRSRPARAPRPSVPAWRSRSTRCSRMRVARLLGPRVVDVVGEQGALELRQDHLRRIRRTRLEGLSSVVVERVDVDVHVLVGQQRHHVVAQQHGRPLATEGPAGVVGGLVQPRTGGRDAGPGPERLDDLLAVQPAGRGRGRGP